MADARRNLLDVQRDAGGCQRCGALPATAGSAAVEPAVDPVCGMSVDPARAPASSSHEGRVYSFCAQGCRQSFGADLDRYFTASH